VARSGVEAVNSTAAGCSSSLDMCLVEVAALAVEADGVVAAVVALDCIFLVELAVAAEAELQAVREAASASVVAALVGQVLAKLLGPMIALLV
jgi:hypothetical protein